MADERVVGAAVRRVLLGGQYGAIVLIALGTALDARMVIVGVVVALATPVVAVATVVLTGFRSLRLAAFAFLTIVTIVAAVLGVR